MKSMMAIMRPGDIHESPGRDERKVMKGSRCMTIHSANHMHSVCFASSSKNACGDTTGK